MFLEILQPNLIQKAPQTGRLNHSIPQWTMLTQDPWVLQTIQGHHIEFMSPPVQHSWPGMPSLPPPQEKVLDQEMKELLAKKAIHQVQTHTPSNRGFISSIFIVPQKDGRNHPVINLKPLNQFLIYEHFKMEGIHMLRDLLKQNDYLVKIDLKDAYLTVPIWKDHQKYLRFLWKGTLHEFACLPFGLATAPRVFTKLMKPVVAALRQRGIRLIIYLDDILIMAESQALASHHSTSTLNLLEEVQLQLVNYNKSQLTPCQSIEFLGFLINSTNLTLQLPGEKLRKIRKTCQDLLEKTEISVRELSKFLGFLTSSIQAIFPGPLHYRHLQRLNNTTMTSEQSYEAILTLDSAAREEVLWWRDHLQGWNGKALFQHPIDLIIEADASRKGWGAYCEGVSTGGPWCSEKKRLHINCLEQLAGSFAIKTFTKTTACAHVRLLLDNAAAVAYINKMGGGGTHSHVLANLAIALWEWCLENQLIVSAQHLPGKLNIRADRESRILIDSSDWKLNSNLFQAILRTWGPLEIDLFASRLTFQLPRFASWKPDPLAIQTDAFTMNWQKIRGYAFPPFALIDRCLQQVMSQKVEQLILISPVWPIQPWYPLLLQLCIDLPILLPPSADLLMKGNQPHPLDNLQQAGWKLSANVSKQQMFQQKLERFCWQRGDETPPVPTPQLGVSGLAGVVNARSTPFQYL